MASALTFFLFKANFMPIFKFDTKLKFYENYIMAGWGNHLLCGPLLRV